MIKKFFSGDVILSLIVAIVLWLYVVSLNNPQVEISVSGIPIELRNTENLSENNLNVISVSNEKTSVKISGRMTEVSQIRPEDIVVYADASEIYSANSYYLKTQAEIDSNTVTVSSVDVKDINVYIDYILAVEKSIGVNTIGQPKEGYNLTETILGADKVLIKGPQNIINKVNSVKATLDITNANGDFSVVCPIKMYSANGEELISDYITISLTDVKVDATMEYSKSVNLNVTLPDNENEEYEVLISPATVLVAGNAKTVDELSEIIVADMSSYTFNESEHKYSFELPTLESVRYVEDSKQVEVTVKVTKKDNA